MLYLAEQDSDYIKHDGKGSIFSNPQRHSFIQISIDPASFFLFFNRGIFFLCVYFMYSIQHCFTSSAATVPPDAGFEPRAVAKLALAARRSNH